MCVRSTHTHAHAHGCMLCMGTGKDACMHGMHGDTPGRRGAGREWLRVRAQDVRWRSMHGDAGGRGVNGDMGWRGTLDPPGPAARPMHACTVQCRGGSWAHLAARGGAAPGPAGPAAARPMHAPRSAKGSRCVLGARGQTACMQGQVGVGNTAWAARNNYIAGMGKRRMQKRNGSIG